MPGWARPILRGTWRARLDKIPQERRQGCQAGQNPTGEEPGVPGWANLFRKGLGVFQAGQSSLEKGQVCQGEQKPSGEGLGVLGWTNPQGSTSLSLWMPFNSWLVSALASQLWAGQP